MIFLRKRLATLLKNVKMTMIHSLWCNVDASWQRRPHGMPLLKTNTAEQISLSYIAKYCQGENIIIIHRQILSRCKYQTPPNIIIVKRQISFTHINIIIFLQMISSEQIKYCKTIHHTPHPKSSAVFYQLIWIDENCSFERLSLSEFNSKGVIYSLAKKREENGDEKARVW